MNLLLTLSWLVVGTGALITLLSFLGRIWWPFELMSHFRVQYSLLLLATAVFALLVGNPAGSLLALLFAAANIIPIAALFTGRPQPPPHNPATPPMLRAIMGNVLWHNTDADPAVAYIRQVQPDLVLFLEVITPFAAGLQKALPDYEYYGWPCDNSPSGVVLLSRIPLQDVHLVHFTERSRPAVVATFQLGERPITLLGPHPAAPNASWRQARRNGELVKIARWVAERPGEVLLLGDLNITPWSPFFHDLLEKGKLRHARAGFGLHPTWPVHSPLLRIPIDHVLVTPGLTVHRFTAGPPIGSDHLPVLVEIF